VKERIEDWDIIVRPRESFFRLNLKEVWQYKDLILLMARRDIVSIYKQTVLGPLWMLIQPIFTTAIYTFTFSYSAGISTDGIPPVLFYLMGQTFWTYFADGLNKTSNTFVANSAVFGKVYFPRLVMPVSVIISNLVKLSIQISLLCIVYLYFFITTSDIHPHYSYFILLPVLILFLGIFGLSLGILFSAYTTKYRDFTFLLAFTVQLIMFASCVVFPLSMYSDNLKEYFLFNPIVAYLETIKYILTGHGVISIMHLLMDSVIVMLILLFSIFSFNKTERSFMDTV
jgi:lipopolysaccharide transport system permease protein